MLKHIWVIVSNQNSLWLQWSHVFVIKSNCFWTMKAPCDCSWTWRKLFQLRPIARPFVRSITGNGTSTFFWYDNCHTAGPLIDYLGSDFVAISGIPRTAKVSSVIFNDVWTWPFLSVGVPPFQPNPHLRDSIVWSISPSSQYHAMSTWNALRSHHPWAAWHKLVWFPKLIPRHSFILWMAIRGKLRTKDKLSVWRVTADAKWLLCNQDEVTYGHLFLYSSFL